jgi:AraC-like DNA-binding protein
MSLIYEERLSDSPYVEAITCGRTVGADSRIRPAELHWHLVFSWHDGGAYPLVVGPLTTSGVVSWTAGGEILWIKLKPGTFMPRLPFKNLVDKETVLPEAAARDSFWLNGSAWKFPNYENADTFIDRLVRDEILVSDPVVSAALQDQPQEMSPRTLRHRFLRATGLSQTHLRQIERAQRAAALLEQGVSILDTVFEAGYFDQSHLTRALKQFIGHTPAQIIHMSQSACHSVQDNDLMLDYHTNVLTKS